MGDPDAARQKLQKISEDFKVFSKTRGGASEADTRVKVIDRILVDVLGWPEETVSREDHVTNVGYIDYTLHLYDHPYVAVEAKKEGNAFTIPHKFKERRYSLNGALVTDKRIKEAINQVREYCEEADIPIKYAIATNGYTWIVFKAIRDDINWRKGTARVFHGLDQIIENFTEFWNLLSYASIENGSLQDEFGTTEIKERKLLRVIDKLYNSDLPLMRNRLHSPLQPVINLIFEDIADQAHVEILQSCYIHTGSLKIIQNDLDDIITRAIPEFLLQEGAKSVGDDKNYEGFNVTFSQSFGANTGRLFLLLGGIGSGKTTFLRRYQRTIGKELLEEKTLWFVIDFKQPPEDPTTLEEAVYKTLLNDFRLRYGDKGYEKLRILKEAFRDKIDVLNNTALIGMRPNSPDYDRALGTYLVKWQEETTEYVPRILRVTCKTARCKVVLFIDNVDQLSPEYQGQIFLLAQRITRVLESITLVSLREESFYTASIQKRFTAFVNHKFHIASPRFRTMIRSRINYALDLLEEKKSVSSVLVNAVEGEARASIADFLRIVGESIFGANKKIVRFIEALCYGNMRFALQMFTQFLVSGATDVDKMLSIYKRDGNYYVAFHEFVKSIMLGDRKYYKEEQSPVMNLLNVGAEKNSSHFTCWRLIRYLTGRRGESSTEGQGYVPLSEIISAFENVFNNRGDVIASLNRLVRNQLVEANTRSTEGVAGASHVRVTSAGIYFVRYLCKSFAYLDLVLQDTPINDEQVEAFLRESVFQVDNLGDREDLKLERVHTRFRRVERFLDYLDKEEQGETKEFNLQAVKGPLGEAIAPSIKQAYENERNWIDRRLRENRERFQDEPAAWSNEHDDSLDDEDEDEVAESEDEQGKPAQPTPQQGKPESRRKRRRK